MKVEYDEFLDMYTVFYCGDEIVFPTEEEANEFIKEMSNNA